MNDTLPDAAAQQIGQSVAALVQELARLKTDICALRARLNAGTLPEARAVSQELADVAQWLGIAQEMEQRFESRSRKNRPEQRGIAELDLRDARDEISRQLDRLRAAQHPDCVS